MSGLIRDKTGRLAPIDLTNKRFGWLIALKENGRNNGSVMWLCKCDCGKEKTIRGASLRTGITKSCGCFHKKRVGETFRIEKGEAFFNRLISEYKFGAKKRGFKWELTKYHARELFNGDCNYCGSEPTLHLNGKWSKSYNGVLLYNGIDRLDNNEGYHILNVVSCCKICNRAKHSLTIEEFNNWIEKIYKYKLLAIA